MKAMPRPPKPPDIAELMRLHHFLLEYKDERIGGKPLFESLTALAHAVAAHELVPTKMSSLISMVEQGVKGKRSFKEERRIALRQAVVERIKHRAPEHLDELIKDFDFYSYVVEKVRRHPYETTSGRNLAPGELIGAAFVIVPHVRDVVATDRGLALVRMFIAAYGLSGRDVPAHFNQKHILAFADDADIFVFLSTVVSESVYEELGERGRPIRQEQVQKVWARMEVLFRKKSLLFALLPSPYCLSAVTVYDCDKEQGKTMVLSYGGGSFRFIQLYGQFRKGYLQLYHDLMDGRIEGASFVDPSHFHEKIIYQLISASAAV
ncbi:OpgC domain-containing protein [Armatimonas rosea]|uniref:Uncharacterized protein n=1 Tax=Armatimonas rosea TaxID=685828 RepID=A0A7W9SW82_ARMRO|nr:hypothetical protein [Armatimonas rosea]